MIPVRLIDGLTDVIKEAVKDYVLTIEGQQEKKITVYPQHIPDENFSSDEYYPLIIVSAQKIDDDEGGTINDSTVDIGLTFGVYGDDENAWRDLLNIMESVRQAVLKNRTINRRHRLILPLKWEVIEAQPYPFWFGYGTLKYTIAQPVEEQTESYYKEEVTS